MAITLNKYAAKLVRQAISEGRIGKDSSAQSFHYDISRHWRKADAATKFKDVKHTALTEKEVEICNVIISAIMYLHRSGCDVEAALKQVLGVKMTT